MGSHGAPRAVTTLLVVDGHALLYMGLILSATMVIIALSYRYLNCQFHEQEGVEEYYLLLLLATFGGLVLTTAAHFVSFFLGFELLGLSLCSLIGYLRTRRNPLEAAVKYLLLSITASAFLLFGLALLYFESGAMTFHEVGVSVKQWQTCPSTVVGRIDPGPGRHRIEARSRTVSHVDSRCVSGSPHSHHDIHRDGLQGSGDGTATPPCH